jgi:hypothetical protein
VDNTGNLPPLPGIYPDYPTPIVRNSAEGRELAVAHMRQLDRVVCAVSPRLYVGVQPFGCFTCPCRKLFGSHVSDIVLRQAPVNVEIDRPTTAHPPASIANSKRPRASEMHPHLIQLNYLIGSSYTSVD